MKTLKTDILLPGNSWISNKKTWCIHIWTFLLRFREENRRKFILRYRCLELERSFIGNWRIFISNLKKYQSLYSKSICKWKDAQFYWTTSESTDNFLSSNFSRIKISAISTSLPSLLISTQSKECSDLLQRTSGINWKTKCNPRKHWDWLMQLSYRPRTGSTWKKLNLQDIISMSPIGKNLFLLIAFHNFDCILLFMWIYIIYISLKVEISIWKEFRG